MASRRDRRPADRAMKLLIDMNLSPRLSAILRDEGWDTVH